MKKVLLIIYIMLSLPLVPASPLQAATVRQYRTHAVQALRDCLLNEAGPLDSGAPLMNAVIRFYEERQFKPAWMSSSGVTRQGAALLAVLNLLDGERTPLLAAYVRHLKMILHDGSQMMHLSTTFPLDDMLKVDIGMTQIALYFAIRKSTESLFPGEETRPPQAAPQPWVANRLANVLQISTWNALLRSAFPLENPFLALKKSLTRFETIRELGGWPAIPEGRAIKPGQKDPRVPLLRKRLIISGDMGLESFSPDQLLDDALAEGIRRFQQRHGLRADGVVGPDTLAELNVGVKERIAQIRLNLARWCRLPARPGPRYLLVNIPGFRLDVVENRKVVESMRAIVGRTERRTPVMSAMMTYLEINPYWNIPQQIAGEDILPKIHKDPGYLLRQNIQVFNSWRKNARALDPMAIDWQRYSKEHFPFRLRQEPSPSNALGQFKFMFPNRFSVYIHDTPAKSLFTRTSRSFSSGCVRIEQPRFLANYLLAAQGWDRCKIEENAKSLKRKVVVLKHPIPVHLVYLTAWADKDGTIHFFQDLYGRDESQMEKQSRFECAQLPSASDLMAVDRILERNNDRAASKPSGGNGDLKIS
jgi:L,D-transpeptidase YcbB